ncbi:DUF3653 domain-containing protein [Vibrio sp. qd031]|uniref:DUF3653 domain-containing protein n=1 Tax=Vibrio sp. qd031 TaxID=1603038 RepID=UPI000A10E0BD|nr:DUF3653 domain-containing protein [Vibrio sp. qd031]
MFTTSFNILFHQNFPSINAGAEFFHVRPVTVKRWLNGHTPPNEMAEKLLIIKAIGYLPNDVRWRGFRINEEKGVLIAPDGYELTPQALSDIALLHAHNRALQTQVKQLRDAQRYAKAKKQAARMAKGYRDTAQQAATVWAFTNPSAKPFAHFAAFQRKKAPHTGEAFRV